MLCKIGVYTQPTNIGLPEVPRTSPFNVTRTSPRDSIWLSRESYDLTFEGRFNLTSWGRLVMMFRGQTKLMFKERP